MTDKEQIQGLYETMYRAMIAMDTVALGSVETDSLEITVDGESARMVGRSRVNAAVYGGGRHTWRLQMDAQLRKENEVWRIACSRASTY